MSCKLFLKCDSLIIIWFHLCKTAKCSFSSFPWVLCWTGKAELVLIIMWPQLNLAPSSNNSSKKEVFIQSLQDRLHEYFFLPSFRVLENFFFKKTRYELSEYICPIINVCGVDEWIAFTKPSFCSASNHIFLIIFHVLKTWLSL